MSNQLQITGGAKVRNLEGVLTGTSGVVNALAINVPNGIPQLDGSGKILVSQLPNSVMEYKGTWDASTNTPTLVNGTGNQGDVYLCNVAGTVNFGAGPITFFVGDQVIYSGTIWQRASGASGTVTSVAVTESGDALTITGSPITTSGTINIGFAGTNLQYINGAGNLTTFPSLTGYVPYTGATANVDLGVYDLTADLITGARGSFASNGGSDTFAINHSSGGGIALNITKGGSGEGLYINKTSGSGNAATIIGTLEATTLVKSGGTSTQFLKADGSVDSSTYLTTSAASSTYLPLAGGIMTGSILLNNNLTISGQLFGTSSYASMLAMSPSDKVLIDNSGRGVIFGGTIGQGAYTYTFPSASGTFALLSANQTFTGLNTFSSTTNMSALLQTQVGIYLNQGIQANGIAPYTAISGYANGLFICPNSGTGYYLVFPTSSSYVYTFPAATGTLALTSNIPANIVTGTGVSGQVAYWSGTSTQTGSNNFLYDSANQSLTFLGLNSSRFEFSNGKFSSTRTSAAINLTFSAENRHTPAADVGSSIGFYGGSTGNNGIAEIYGAWEGASTNNGYFAIQTVTSGTRSEKLRINSTGYVGINTLLPAYFLDVAGTGRFTGQLLLGSTITNGTYTYTLPSSTGTFALTSDLSSYLPLTGGTLSGTLNGTSINSTAASKFATSSGNVLIGTNTDNGQKLQVAGQIRATGAINLNTSDIVYNTGTTTIFTITSDANCHYLVTGHDPNSVGIYASAIVIVNGTGGISNVINLGSSGGLTITGTGTSVQMINIAGAANGRNSIIRMR